MQKAFEYIVLNLTRDRNMSIQFKPEHKINIEQFKKEYADLILEIPNDTLLSQISSHNPYGVSKEDLVKTFRSLISPKPGYHNELFIVALDYLGKEGWRLTTCRQSDAYVEYIFIREG